MQDAAEDRWGPYKRADLDAMKTAHSAVKLPMWVAPDGNLLVVVTLDSGKKHWVQYDEAHKVYRVVEKKPLGTKLANGIVTFGNEWFEVR